MKNQHSGQKLDRLEEQQRQDGNDSGEKVFDPEDSFEHDYDHPMKGSVSPPQLFAKSYPELLNEAQIRDGNTDEKLQKKPTEVGKKYQSKDFKSETELHDEEDGKRTSQH